MLAVSKYDPDYVKRCEARVKADVAAYRELSASADAFAAVFFNNMVLTLELQFVHRLRKAEGKDGNALNEVRLLASSLIENGGVMLADKQITFANGSVLGYEPGDTIRLSEADFRKLSTAFYKEISARCT